MNVNKETTVLENSEEKLTVSGIGIICVTISIEGFSTKINLSRPEAIVLAHSLISHCEESQKKP